MSRILIVVGVLVVIALAGWGVVYGSGYFQFKNLQNQCSQKFAVLDNTISVSFDQKSDFSKIQMIADDIQLQPGVHSSSAQSSDDQLQAFIHEQTQLGNQDVIDALKVTGNTFEPSVEISIDNNQNISSTIGYLDSEAEHYGVTIDSVHQTDSKATVAEILTMKDTPVVVASLQNCVNSTSSPSEMF